MKTQDVKKAVVLAAGFGTRLDPVTRILPKPLLPICGVPSLERIVRLLERWGVREVAVNAHHLAERVHEFADRRNKTGTAKITVFDEPQILGTGGALRPMDGFLGGEPFWLVSGDVAIEHLDPVPLVEAFEKSGGFASCWLEENAGPRTVEADPEGRVCCWRSPTPGVGGTYTYCGFALLGPQVRRFLPEGENFCSIVDAYENAMMSEAHFTIGVTESQAWWSDFGTFDSYLETHLALDPEGFERFPNVLFDGVKLETDAELAGVVATGGLIGGRLVHCAAVDLARLHEPRLDALAEKLGWTPADTAAVLVGERGSDRVFWRLVHGAERAMAVLYDDSARAENARYVKHAIALAEAGLRVPRVLADLPELKASAFEDLGDDSLQSRRSGADAKPAPAADDYRPAAEWLAAFHAAAPRAVEQSGLETEPPFGPELYAWERDLFENCYVKARLGFDEGIPAEVAAELRHAAEALDGSPQTIVHRDYQSSNIIFAPDGEAAAIDFQGMRRGPAAYDLASLVFDPYVKLTKAERNAAAALYAQKAENGKEIMAVLPQAGVQRLVQALGAYGRLVAAGKRQFAECILPALELLHGLAHEATLPGLASFTHTLMARERMIPA